MMKKLKIKEKYRRIIESLLLNETQKLNIENFWLDYLLLVDKSAKKGWRNHNYSQMVIIVFGIAIPIIETTSLNDDIFGIKLTIVGILSFIIAGLTGINRQFGFEDKWRHYRSAAETMRNEGDDFFALSGRYKDFKSHQEAYKDFSEIIIRYKRNEFEKIIEIKDNKEPK